MASENVAVVKLDDGREVCLSYGVIVAAFIPRDNSRVCYRSQCIGRARGSACDCPRVSGYVRTDARYSVTTSKHMNQYAGKDSPTIPHADLLQLCAPIKSRE